MARDIILIGASAGGVPALKTLFAHFSPIQPVSVFVVLHISPHAESFLPEILGMHNALSISHAVDGGRIEPNHVYIAPPDQHLIVEYAHMHLTKGPKENRTRPAINPLFRSAALAYGSRVIGVILSGMLDDGTIGLWEIKRRGGVAVVQCPDDAQYDQMPDSAITNVDVDHQVSAADMGALLIKLTAEEPKHSITHVESVMPERTHLTCPDCHGPIDRLKYGNLTEYRCRVGHAYSGESMLAAHEDAEERALWSAVESLEEGADLVSELGNETPSDKSEDSAVTKRKLSKTIRSAIESSKAKKSSSKPA